MADEVFNFCNLGMIVSLPYTLTTYDTGGVAYRLSPSGDVMYFVVDDDSEMTCIKWEEIDFQC
jgi:hypothetical protein